jgi:hypothetical protein
MLLLVEVLSVMVGLRIVLLILWDAQGVICSVMKPTNHWACCQCALNQLMLPRDVQTCQNL